MNREQHANVDEIRVAYSEGNSTQQRSRSILPLDLFSIVIQFEPILPFVHATAIVSEGQQHHRFTGLFASGSSNLY
jgi:hypothetical protein